MKPLKSIEKWFVRKVDIRVTFAALCVAILLLILSLSPPLFRSQSVTVNNEVHFNLWDEHERRLDVHLEGPRRGHDSPSAASDSVVSHLHHVHRKSNLTSVALGIAITTRDQQYLTLENIQYRSPLLKTFFPSFCKTASQGYEYNFYIAFDMNDPFLRQKEFLEAIHAHFQTLAHQFCPSGSHFLLHFVQCNHNRSPSWAQNDAMMEAYLDGADYFYRVNDDTQLLSPQWTETFINALKGFSPPNVGIVGPSHKGGNEDILTYDFVHHTHIDIFGYYYPRLFTDWWADNWMTSVYGQQRTQKLPGVKIMHTLEAGTRYHVQMDVSAFVEHQLAEDRATLNRYLKAIRTSNKSDALNKVISFSLWGDVPRYTFGALRNAQLAPVYFPSWKMRVYVEKPSDKHVHHPVPEGILEKLQQLGVEVLHVDASQSHVPPMMWRFLVADDMQVDYFIVRDADARLSERDSIIVNEWIKAKKPFHCVRDHPSHATFPLLGGMWGAQPQKLRDIMRIPWQDLMMGYRQDYVMDMTFLANAVWPKVQSVAYCHDSVSCDVWPNAHPFPLPRSRAEHVGQVFDAFGNARDDDVKIIMQRPVVEECFTWQYNISFSLPKTSFMGLTFEEDKDRLPAKLVPQSMATLPPGNLDETQPSTLVLWSVELNSGPIRDIKNTLGPLGVSFIDNSLSSKCHYARNCASNLKVLTKRNVMTYDLKTAKNFIAEYEGDVQMNLVSHFICTFPASLCEYYLPLKKPIILYFTHRYEMGRYIPADLSRWNQNLAAIAQNPENTIAANNQYDAEYLNYFTGIQPHVIPSLCKYVTSHYKPILHSVLLNPSHNPNFDELFINNFKRHQNSSLDIFSIGDIYPEYTHGNISSHLAIIHIPYQVSTMTLCEHYAMNIPLFVPSVDLLISWHLKFSLLSAITFNDVRNIMKINSTMPLSGKSQYSNPLLSSDVTMLKQWLVLAEFYTRKHIITFSSMADLIEKLNTLDLSDVSDKMSQENFLNKRKVFGEWRRVFRGV